MDNNQRCDICLNTNANGVTVNKDGMCSECENVLQSFREIKNKPKIYLWCERSRWSSGDVIGYALAEDSRGLGSHLSSGVEWSKHDMGLTSDWKHGIYDAHYPDGYELVWLDKFEQNDGWKRAMTLNESIFHENQMKQIDKSGIKTGDLQPI